MYLWDYSEVEGPGARFENMVASHLLKWVHYNNDFGLPPLELKYIRNKEKIEVDFLILRNKKPWFLIEVKNSDKSVSSSLVYFSKQLGNIPTVQLVSDLNFKGVKKESKTKSIGFVCLQRLFLHAFRRIPRFMVLTGPVDFEKAFQF